MVDRVNYVKGSHKLKRFTVKPLWIPWLVFLTAAIAYKYFFGTEQIFAFASKLAGILRPFVVGFAVAYIVNIPAVKIEPFISKHMKNPRPAAIATVYIILVLIIVVSATLLFPVVQSGITELMGNAPEYYEKARMFLRKWDNIGITDYLNGILSETELPVSNIGSYMKNIADLTGGIADIFISVIVAVYSSVSAGKIKKRINEASKIFIPSGMLEKIKRAVEIADGVFSEYIVSKGADALIVMLLSAVIMGLMRVKYAAVLAVIIGLFNMIPYIGAIVSGAAAVLLTFITGGASRAMQLLVFLIVLQQADANFISVKLMGHSLDLDPLEVIFAISLGGGFFGAAGMFFAVPVFASVKEIFADIMRTGNANMHEGDTAEKKQ
ncbi:MAG: AI-2E family transporter [Oscillospiraceae bacterium]|nr:AI-2E family transporter [Oscillospiraceae bacterium]